MADLRSEKNVVLLIREIRKRRCLWDHQDKTYNDRIHIRLAWKQISKKLNVSEERLRIKWKNLRDAFNKVQKRLRLRDSSYSGNWPLYKELSFIHRSNNCNSSPSIEEDDSSLSYLESNHDTNDDMEKEFKTECDENEYVEGKLETSSEGDGYSGDEEHDLMFLISLAPFMEKINPMRKLILRSRIQDMLLNEVVSQKQENENRRNAKRRKL